MCHLLWPNLSRVKRGIPFPTLFGPSRIWKRQRRRHCWRRGPTSAIWYPPPPPNVLGPLGPPRTTPILPLQHLKPTDRLYVQQIFYRPPPPPTRPAWETDPRLRELKTLFDLFDERGLSPIRWDNGTGGMLLVDESAWWPVLCMFCSVSYICIDALHLT